MDNEPYDPYLNDDGENDTLEDVLKEKARLKEEKVIKLNFGKSEFIKYSPREAADTEPDMIINIPETGDLEGRVLCISGSKPYISRLHAENGDFEAVIMKGEGDYKNDFTVEKKTYLAWIPERQGWVGIEHERWEEARPRYDERYCGPFALGEQGEKAILKAYGVPESWSRKASIKKTCPSELKNMSKIYAESVDIKADGTALSVNFSKEGDDDSYAVDWDWGVPGKWTISCKEYGLGHKWERGSGLNEQARKALLDEFGLQDKADMLPIVVIELKTPAELAELAGKCKAAYQRKRGEIYD